MDKLAVIVLIVIAGTFTLSSFFCRGEARASDQRSAIICLLLSIIVCLYEMAFVG